MTPRAGIRRLGAGAHGLIGIFLSICVASCSSHESETESGQAERDAGPVAASDASPTGLAGVHQPISIDPSVDIADDRFVADLYRVILDREGDPGGVRTHLNSLQVTGISRAQLFNQFLSSAEFQSKPELKDRRQFLARLFLVLLGRSPTDSELDDEAAQTRTWDGTGAGRSWLETLLAFYARPGFKSAHCHDGYYSLHAPVDHGSLLMDDLFSGKARLQTIEESEIVELDVPGALRLWDNKLAIVPDPRGGYLAFTRGMVEEGPPYDMFNVFALRSSDGVQFAQEGGPIFARSAPQTFYDPHIAIDSSVCPARYVMTMECLSSEGAGLCTSQTTTPHLQHTWSVPRIVVDGCDNNPAGVCNSGAYASASTGVALIDGADRYISWTQVYDGVTPGSPDDGDEHTYSLGRKVTSFDEYVGTATSSLKVLLGATPQPYCTEAWDCNNRDVQDWKREGDHYYAIYNGANYYRCNGQWGVSLARSTIALETADGVPTYAERLPLSSSIEAQRNDICGISYPYVNVIDGELFVYYAYYPPGGGNRSARARLVPLEPAGGSDE